VGAIGWPSPRGRAAAAARRGGVIVRRIIIVVVVTVAAFSTLGMTPASAAGCPSKASGFVPYPIHGSLGDPAPASSVEPLWDIVVAGAAEEGLTVEELAASLGLDVNGLYDFALAAWFGIDKNGDRTVCVRPFPEESQGKLAYFFNFIDNNAAASG
jgi:hypothetical protein